jgi:hypothetical protein
MFCFSRKDKEERDIIDWLIKKGDDAEDCKKLSKLLVSYTIDPLKLVTFVEYLKRHSMSLTAGEVRRFHTEKM